MTHCSEHGMKRFRGPSVASGASALRATALAA